MSAQKHITFDQFIDEHVTDDTTAHPLLVNQAKQTKPKDGIGKSLIWYALISLVIATTVAALILFYPPVLPAIISVLNVVWAPLAAIMAKSSLAGAAALSSIFVAAVSFVGCTLINAVSKGLSNLPIFNKSTNNKLINTSGDEYLDLDEENIIVDDDDDDEDEDESDEQKSGLEEENLKKDMTVSAAFTALKNSTMPIYKQPKVNRKQLCYDRLDKSRLKLQASNNNDNPDEISITVENINNPISFIHAIENTQRFGIFKTTKSTHHNNEETHQDTSVEQNEGNEPRFTSAKPVHSNRLSL